MLLIFDVTNICRRGEGGRVFCTGSIALCLCTQISREGVAGSPGRNLGHAPLVVQQTRCFTISAARETQRFIFLPKVLVENEKRLNMYFYMLNQTPASFVLSTYPPVEVGIRL